MGKHETSFARVERDLYPTPSWVISEALAQHVDLAGMRVWECACGNGQMAEALKAAGASVFASDVKDYGYVDSTPCSILWPGSIRARPTSALL